MTGTATKTPGNNYDLIGWMRKNNRATCTTCSTHFSGILWRSLPNDNVKFPNLRFLTTMWAHNSKSILQRRLYRSTCSFLCQQHRMRGRSNNPKIATISQMFILKWRFRCRCYCLSSMTNICYIPRMEHLSWLSILEKFGFRHFYLFDLRLKNQ